MALKFLNKNWTFGSYIEDRVNIIAVHENRKLYDSNLEGELLHFVGKTQNPTIGFGFDFRKSGLSPAEIQQFLNGYIIDPSRRVTDAQRDALATYLAKSPPGENDVQVLKDSWSTVRINRDEAKVLFNYMADHVVNDAFNYEAMLNSAIGETIEPSRERIALLDLVYNGGPGMIGSNIQDIVRNWGDRLSQHAALWAEIRYDSNGGRYDRSVSYGLQNRRNAGSDYIGLFSNGGNDPAQVSLDEVKAVAGLLYRGRYGSDIVQDGVDNQGFYQGDHWVTYAGDYSSFLAKVTGFLGDQFADGLAVDWVSSDQRLGDNSVLVVHALN